MIAQRPKRRRNRQPKPQITLSGATLDFWRSSPALLSWAQTDQTFRAVIAVVTNERGIVRNQFPNDTEGQRLGRVEGYEMALGVLHALAAGADSVPPPPPDPTYQADNDSAWPHHD